MQLQINYDVGAARVLAPGWSDMAKRLRRAGVDRMWVSGYQYGNWTDTPENIAKAKRILEEDGFRTGAISLPFGHGGNALNPDDPTVILTTGKGWRLRCTRDGRVMPNTTCVEDTMLADSVEAVRVLRDIGFDEVFYDDDLRLAMWGSEVQGCFCPDCLARFRQQIPDFVPEMLEQDPQVREAWCDFQCRNLTRFVKAVTIPGIRTGIMVMHNGDRRHGIDIPMLRQAVPELFFRVGEGHFGDGSFEAPEGRESILTSIHNHMALVGNDELCYSECTVFPDRALRPENLMEKLRMEILCGIRHIFLMSGSYFLPEEYWAALEARLEEFRALAERTPAPEHPMREPIWQI